jgi:allophanate hydrolase subunit 1
MSSVGFARARAASHQTKASQTIELIAGQRTLTVDYEKLYQISDEKFDLSLTVVVLSEEEKPSENVVTWPVVFKWKRFDVRRSHGPSWVAIL